MFDQQRTTLPVVTSRGAATVILIDLNADRLAEAAAIVKPDLAMILDALGLWQLCARIGTVTGSGQLTMKSGDSVIVNSSVEDLARAFKRTLDW